MVPPVLQSACLVPFVVMAVAHDVLTMPADMLRLVLGVGAGVASPKVLPYHCAGVLRHWSASFFWTCQRHSRSTVKARTVIRRRPGGISAGMIWTSARQEYGILVLVAWIRLKSHYWQVSVPEDIVVLGGLAGEAIHQHLSERTAWRSGWPLRCMLIACVELQSCQIR